MSEAKKQRESGSGASVVIRRPVDVWFTMVHLPTGPIRVGRAHRSHEAARDWLPIVKGQWRYFRVSVRKLTVRFGPDGQIDERTKARLDSEFNMDPPSAG